MNLSIKLKQLPIWLWILLSLFLAKGLVVAAVLGPWAGEDEASHYGYIDNLAFTKGWYAFDSNHSSIETRMAHRWWDIAEDRQMVVEEFGKGVYGSYQTLHSDHQNTTAYQPPLYYWLQAQWQNLPYEVGPFLLLYFYRLVNLTLGVLYLVVVYAIARRVLLHDGERLLMVGFVGWLPLLTLLSATVTVQVTVFLLFGLLFWALLESRTHSFVGYSLAVGITFVGLWVQQALFIVPIIVGSFAIVDWVKKRLVTKNLMIILLLLLVAVGIAMPQIIRRHHETRYTATSQEVRVRRLDVWHYLPSQLERIKGEVIGAFVDQNRSMIVYYAASPARNMVRLLSGLSVLGFCWFLFERNRVKISAAQRWFMMIGGLALLMFMLGHFWFDLLQVLYSGQEYLKARYWYPLLPFFAFIFVFGLQALKLPIYAQRVIMLFSIVVFIWLQTTAMVSFLNGAVIK